jgi:hypothetical protein
MKMKKKKKKVMMMMIMWLQENSFKVQTLTHWKMIGRSMTFPRALLSPSSIRLPMKSSRDFIVERENLKDF